MSDDSLFDLHSSEGEIYLDSEESEDHSDQDDLNDNDNVEYDEKEEHLHPYKSEQQIHHDNENLQENYNDDDYPITTPRPYEGRLSSLQIGLIILIILSLLAIVTLCCNKSKNNKINDKNKNPRK